MTGHTYYFVTDIEADGPNPAWNSMLAFASVAVRDDGLIGGAFETVLAPLPEHAPDDQTMRWWRSEEAAWQAATQNPRDAAFEMHRFVAWVGSHQGIRGFAARSLLFDGMWIEYYLRLFTRENLFGVNYSGDPVFNGPTIDLETYAMGLFGRTRIPPGFKIPQEWLGNHPHSHRAIDDTLGYAHFLSRLLKSAGQTTPHPDDFFGLQK